MQELKLSPPPRKITLLPALKQSEAASAQTLGRASKITHKTPKGIVIRLISSPLSTFQEAKILPTGSGKAATFFTPSATALRRSPVKRSLSLKARAFSAERASISCPLALSMAGVFLIILTAALNKTLFLSSVPAEAKTQEASFALMHISFIVCLLFFLNSLFYRIIYRKFKTKFKIKAYFTEIFRIFSE